MKNKGFFALAALLAVLMSASLTSGKAYASGFGEENSWGDETQSSPEDQEKAKKALSDLSSGFKSIFGKVVSGVTVAVKTVGSTVADGASSVNNAVMKAGEPTPEQVSSANIAKIALMGSIEEKIDDAHNKKKSKSGLSKGAEAKVIFSYAVASTETEKLKILESNSNIVNRIIKISGELDGKMIEQFKSVNKGSSLASKSAAIRGYGTPPPSTSTLKNKQ